MQPVVADVDVAPHSPIRLVAADAADVAPDDPGELSPDTPETLPPAPVEPMPGPDDPDAVPA
jgi:hypothetical protein